MSLFSNEKLAFARHEETVGPMPDEDINLKYVNGEFRIVTI